MINFKLLRKLLSVFISVSMLFNSQIVFAQQSKPTVVKNELTSNIIKGIDTLGKAFDKANQTFRNNPSLGQAQIYGSLRPAFQRSQYFPECSLPVLHTSPLNNLCARGDHPQSLQGVRSLASAHVEILERSAALGQTKNPNEGIQCLKNSHNSLKQTLQDQINRLQRYKDTIAESLKKGTNSVESIKEGMDKVISNLYGDKGRKDLDKRADIFANQFTPSCRNIIGNDLLKAQSGLIDIRDKNLSDANQASSNLISNRTSIESDLNREIQTIKNEILKQGISWSTKTSVAKFQMFSGLRGIAAIERAKLIKEYETARAMLKKDVGYELPSFDKADSNFSKNINDFSSHAKDYFRKKYINECVTSADSGVSVGVENILKSLKHVNRVKGDRLVRYRNALRSILNSDSYIEDKLDSIRRLDQEYREQINITYQDGSSNRISKTPYGLFQDLVASCDKKLSENDSFSTKQSGLHGTQEQRIARANRYINKVKKLASTYASNMGNEIYNQIINCNGQELKSGECTNKIEGGVLDVNKPSYCISKAVSCAEKVRTCYREVDSKVIKEKAKLKVLANDYNKRVSRIYENQKKVLGVFNAQVQTVVNYLKKFSLDKAYIYPKDVLIQVPNKKLSEKYGVLLVGDEENGIENLAKELPIKLDKLIASLNNQRDNVDKSMANYWQSEQRKFRDHISKWNGLNKRCVSSLAYAKQQQLRALKAQQNIMSQHKEMTGDFCANFEIMQRSPRSACNDEAASPGALFRQMGKIGNVLDPSVGETLDRHIRYCDEVVSSSSGEEDYEAEEEDLEPSKLSQLCINNDYDSEAILNDLKDRLLNIADAKSEVSREQISDYISAKEEKDLEEAKNSLPDGFFSTKYGAQLYRFRRDLIDNDNLSKNNSIFFQKINGTDFISKVEGFCSKNSSYKSSCTTNDGKGFLDKLKKGEYYTYKAFNNDLAKFKENTKGAFNEFPDSYTEIEILSNAYEANSVEKKGICELNHNMAVKRAVEECFSNDKVDKSCVETKTMENLSSNNIADNIYDINNRIKNIELYIDRKHDEELGEDISPCLASENSSRSFIEEFNRRVLGPQQYNSFNKSGLLE